LLPLLQEALNHLYIHYDTKDISEIFAQERAAFAKVRFGDAELSKEHRTHDDR